MQIWEKGSFANHFLPRALFLCTLVKPIEKAEALAHHHRVLVEHEVQQKGAQSGNSEIL